MNATLKLVWITRELIERKHVTEEFDVWYETLDGDWVVMGVDADGREYCHEHRFKDRLAAEKLVNRIYKAKLRIVTEFWHSRAPYGTQAWLDDGMEVTLMSDEERYHKGM